MRTRRLLIACPLLHCKAHHNAVENLVVFAALVLAAQATDISNSVTDEASCDDATMSRETFQRSLGSTLQLACYILLLALIPYSGYAGFWLYQTASSWSGGDAGPLVYAVARAIACVILIYALWQLRKTGLRLRAHPPPGK